jgi:YHS domain-containing protein
MAIDPICNMEVDENSAKYKTEYKGKTYYFCAPGCKKTFENNPTKYTDDVSSGSRQMGHSCGCSM